MDACKDFDLTQRNRPEAIEKFERAAAKRLYNKKQQDAEAAYLSQSTTADALKTLPPIVVELMEEFQLLNGEGRFSGNISQV